MVYQIEIDSVAKRFLKKLSASEYQAVRRDIEALAANPRPEGYLKMTGFRDLYRIRTGSTGDFRIVYMIQDKKLLVRLSVLEIAKKFIEVSKGVLIDWCVISLNLDVYRGRLHIFYPKSDMEHAPETLGCESLQEIQ